MTSGESQTELPFQILSLDGGGLKGLFAAAVLAELEADLQTRLVDHFDLVVGTSTGALVALGLGAGYTPKEIVDFYLHHGPAVFSRPRRASRLVRPKHDARRLKSALTDLFGGRLLGESVVRLLIPAYSLERNDVYVFKTPHHEDLARDWKETMVDVALATSAAPTYFAAAHLRNNRLIDGGVWANNPALVGVAESVGVLDVALTRLRVLSLGTSDELANLDSRLDTGGLAAWARRGRTVFLRAPAIGSFHTVKYLIGKSNAVRVDPVVPDGLFSLDRVDPRRIRGLAEGAARDASPKIRPFLAHRAPPYAAFYT